MRLAQQLFSLSYKYKAKPKSFVTKKNSDNQQLGMVCIHAIPFCVYIGIESFMNPHLLIMDMQLLMTMMQILHVMLVIVV